MHLEVTDSEQSAEPGPAACPMSRLADPLAYVDGSFHRLWARMRSDAPVSWTPPTDDRPGFWNVTSYPEVREVLKDHRTYSSEHGTILDSVAVGGDSAGGLTVTLMDPPVHSAIRAEIGSLLTLKEAQAAAPEIRQRVRRLTEPWWSGGTHDVAPALERLSALAFGDVIGILPTHWDELSRWTTASIAPEDPVVAAGRPAETVLRDAHHHLFACFRDSLRAKRERPGRDIASLLTRFQLDGSRLSEREQLLNIYSIVLGAGSTTPQAANHLLLLLAKRPELLTGIRSGEVAVRKLLEETVRWVTPTNHLVRRAAEDTELGGQKVRSGDWVCLWIASANRDGTRFQDADLVQPARTGAHVGYGVGPHICVGMHFARVALEALVEEVARRVSRITVAGPVRHLASTFINGITQLPLTFEVETHGPAER